MEHHATPDLSVVIVTHNGRELALRTLGSAMAAAGRLSVEWIVVDSGSSDGTPDAIQADWPEVLVNRLPNVGFAAANNVGFAQARGRYVLALNPDTEVLEGTFAQLVAAMDARPRIGVASVIQEFADGTLQPSIRRYPSVGRVLSEALLIRALPGCRGLQERELEPGAYQADRSADWLVGAFLLLRREALGDVAGFDQRFFMYSEETDLCRRIRDAGWDVRHIPAMRILHHGGAPSPRLVAQHAYSRVEYARKHFGRTRAAAFRLAIALHHLVRFFAFGALRRASERGAGERHALAVALGVAPPPFAGGES